MVHNKKGFTLIELLVVIAIIGILSTLAVVSLGNARTRARDSKRLADMRAVQSALELYYTDQSRYPADAIGTDVCAPGTTLEACCLDNETTVDAAGWRTTCTGGPGATLITVPADPRDNAVTVADPNLDQYVYSVNTAGDRYTIRFNLEAATSGLALGANCVQTSGMTSRECPTL